MYPPHHLGGYELACRDAVVRWREHGHGVTVLTTDVRFPLASGAEEDGVRRQLDMYWRDGEVVSPPLRERLKIERRNLSVLRKTLDEVSPDVVSAWHMGALSLGILTEIRRRNIPVVLVIYDQWLIYGPVVDAWTRIFTKRSWARAAAARLSGVPTSIDIDDDDVTVCFMSEWLRKQADDKSPLRLPSRQAVVYGGIDHSLFTPGERRATFAWRLLCAGRVERRKGVHVAIEALAQLPDEATLDIVGTWDDESYVAELRERATSLGIAERVRWHGQSTRTELVQWYRDSDIFLFPVVWDEPFGLVPLEAMACGTPVIGTGTGGSNEFLVDELNCLRVVPEDASGLANAIRRLASDEHLRTGIVDAGSKTAAYLSDDAYLDELEAWHSAASTHFPNGEPPGREALADVLARLRRRASPSGPT